jgi:hypothetical protein
MRKQVMGTIAAAAMLAMSAAATGSPITYDFTVNATSGPLSGDTASGSFTFDSSTIPSGGGTVFATGLLTALNFTWDSISYDAVTANTGWLTFNPTGSLTGFVIGNDCTALSCTVITFTPGWLAAPGVMGFGYATAAHTPIGFGNVSYSLASAVPEPATFSLLALALACLGITRRRRAKLDNANPTCA